MLVQLTAKKHVINDIWAFWFEPRQPLHYIAGQYVELTVPHTPMDSRGDRRWLSIASAPHEGTPLLFTMRIPATCSSFKRALMATKPGSLLHISEPIGDFVLPRLATVPSVLVAFGIGITPMRSIVCQAQHEQRGHLTSFHVATPAEYLFTDILSAIPHHKTPLSATLGRISHFTDHILTTVPSPAESMFYLSGPEPPVIATMENLLAHGINRQQIVLDYFPGY